MGETMISSILLIISLAVVGCKSSVKQSQDLRTRNVFPEEKPATESVTTNKPIDVTNDLTLQPVAGMGVFPKEQFDNFMLASRLDDGGIVLVGRNGTSYQYGGPDGLIEIQPRIVPPVSRQLLTISSQDFWLVGDQISRPKAGANGEGEDGVTLINYSLDSFSGDKSKLRVLFVSANSIIFATDEKIGIISYRNGLDVAFQFGNPTIPFPLETIVSAGESTKQDSYWFASQDNRFVLLENIDGNWSRNHLNISVKGVEKPKFITFKLDRESSALVGEALALTEDAVYSTSGVALAVQN